MPASSFCTAGTLARIRATHERLATTPTRRQKETSWCAPVLAGVSRKAFLRSQTRTGPASGASLIEQSLVESVCAFRPQLDCARAEPIASPIRRARDRPPLVLGRELRGAVPERVEAGEGSALCGGP